MQNQLQLSLYAASYAVLTNVCSYAHDSPPRGRKEGEDGAVALIARLSICEHMFIAKC